MNIKVENQIYNSPREERIKLDNDISLILESGNSNLGESGLLSLQIAEYFNYEPYKTDIG